jgi:hypothetical protein
MDVGAFTLQTVAEVAANASISLAYGVNTKDLNLHLNKILITTEYIVLLMLKAPFFPTFINIIYLSDGRQPR